MKKVFLYAVLFLILASAGVLYFVPGIAAEIARQFGGDEPDLPDFAAYKINKEEFMLRRAENIGMLRGFEKDKAVDPRLRMQAIEQLEMQEASLDSPQAGSWVEIGPNPIPNAQVSVPPVTTASGRTIAIAVHPSNANIVYVGTAQGGLYRSLDGGTNWTRMMDSAISLAIGAIAIAPSQPDTVYVGTGEPNFSGDSFFGVGIYRITNASTSSPTLSGPFNFDGAAANVFTGRSIAEILVHPSDPNTIFVASASGIGGISGSANNVLPSRGVYRSTNALSVSPTFAKLTGLAANANSSVRDIIIDPLNPNLLVANVVASAGTGGIYVSADALGATPTFTQRVVFPGSSTSSLTAEFAIHHTSGPNPTIYAAVGDGDGRVLRSIDGGVTWTQQIDNNFCSPQCFYDIAIDVDPTNPNNVYLGGAPAVIFARSNDGGVTFTGNATTAQGLHVDSHAIAVAPSSPTTIYFGSDGGIYKTTNSGTSWTSLNNSQFTATQFMSLAVHSIDQNFTIGGTQDNGTNYYRPDGTWTRIVGGDGGYSLIDQSDTSTTSVDQFHTFFNATSLQGYGHITTAGGGSTFRGCQTAGATVNGITCNGTILFYAPLEQGPGTPNTTYYGSDRLYRSSNNGLNHTVVSQNPIVSGVPLSAIGISPQNDNVRLVGLANGGIWGTMTGSATLTDLDTGGAVPNNFIARAVIDPTNINTAYVTLSTFSQANVVWKTTNLNAGTPTWTAASSGLPQVPVSAFVVDPLSPNTLYAGTDIGVYRSTNGGSSWQPFSAGLPRVAVFDIALTAGSRRLRIATHGRGMWQYQLRGGTAVSDFDGDGRSDIAVWRDSDGVWYWLNSSTSTFSALHFGTGGDLIVPGDYDFDGRTDPAVYRPSTGIWYAQQSTAGFTAYPFGSPGDLPSQGDFDGDGKTDFAVFRPSNGVWYLQQSTAGFAAFPFGSTGDRPSPGDYDGDGKTDVAVFRPSNGAWYMQRSTAGFSAVLFGFGTDKIAPGDYDGDTLTDVAVYRESSGVFYILRSMLGFQAVAFGTSGDIPAPGDFEGDSKTDFSVFRPSNGVWYRLNSSSGAFAANAFGLSGDKPVPAGYVPVQ